MECDLLEVMWTEHAKIFGEAIGSLRGKVQYYTFHVSIFEDSVQ